MGRAHADIIRRFGRSAPQCVLDAHHAARAGFLDGGGFTG